MVQMRSALAGIPVARAMLTDFRTVSPGDTLARAVELVLAGSQPEFPVVEDDRVVGVLTQQDLLAGLTKHGPEAPVAGMMRRDFQSVEPSEMLEVALTRLQACTCHTLPVTQSGRLVGFVTMENVGEFLRIQSALAGRPG